MNWDEYFVNIAEQISFKSKDGSTKIGCVVVGPDNQIKSAGFNGLPIGLDDDVQERHERPEKYFWFEHAERNSLYLANRSGVSLQDCTLYLNCEPSGVCADCARGIIQSGIEKVVGPDKEFTGNKQQYSRSNEVAMEMLEEAGVKVVTLNKQDKERIEPYRMNGYTLYKREVELKNGGVQTIYFFSKKNPKHGVPCSLPVGYSVSVNDRTGLPYVISRVGFDG